MKKVLPFLLAMMLVFVAACSGQKDNGASNTGGNQGASGEASQKVKLMKISITVPKERSYARALYAFEEQVEKETNGSIDVEIYPDGQLGGDRDNIEGMQMDLIQGSLIAPGPIANFVQQFNVFDLPFIFKDEETAYEVLDGPIGQEVLDLLPDVGLVGLNYWENGFRHLTNDVREVKTPEDVKGLKLRTLENQLHIDLWQTLGAIATPIPYPELYLALQQSVVDGQENPPGNITTAKFYEVQKYITKTGHVYNPLVFLISKTFWDSLTDAEKEIIVKAANDARDYQRELNRQENEEAYQLMEENGMTITELTDEQKQAFKAAMDPIYTKYAPEIGEDIVNKVLEATK